VWLSFLSIPSFDFDGASKYKQQGLHINDGARFNSVQYSILLKDFVGLAAAAAAASTEDDRDLEALTPLLKSLREDEESIMVTTDKMDYSQHANGYTLVVD
jgi:hypothetical protein